MGESNVPEPHSPVHESSAEDSNEEASYEEPSPLDPPCAKRQHHEEPDLDYLPIDEKGNTPFEKYGFISHDDWNDFATMMTSMEAKGISESYQKLSKKNTLRPNLGLGGYQAKLVLKSSEISEVLQKAKDLAVMEKEDTFKPEREKD
ncbi:hypothetical protein PR202_gb03179 [Eleusine coracana subsp. coracana]|uniref:Uncharacterized protein n=1 Tax=Eleusine coracana subsp. coracana TaxID=191504 RepID=A0AAV5E118_ELECO|nr:hypothetical protein PR202_gb03179 [Eleusine coracana subsp. coracana]